MESRRAPAALPALSRLLVAVVISTGIVTGFSAFAAPHEVQAGTAETMESSILGWINASRVKLGLKALRVHSGLTILAGDRAATMASTGVLSHTVSGCLSCQLTARRIQWYMDGEVIAENTYPWGNQSALALFNWWKSSSTHWDLLMSRSFNYLGVGVAYRSSNRMTFGSVVLTESVDQTAPWARMVSGNANGTTASWAWTGDDAYLQTHTSGLRNFDVEYRIDSGSWAFLLRGTTARSLSLSGRAHGHYYGIRVRSRDWRGYLSWWTPETQVWIH